MLQSVGSHRTPDMSVYGTVSIVCMAAVCCYHSAVRAAGTNHGECSSNILRWPVSIVSTSIHSMQHSPSWEANSFSATRESPRIYGACSFITVCARVRHLALSKARQIQQKIIDPQSKHNKHFSSPNSYTFRFE